MAPMTSLNPRLQSTKEKTTRKSTKMKRGIIYSYLMLAFQITLLFAPSYQFSRLHYLRNPLTRHKNAISSADASEKVWQKDDRNDAVVKEVTEHFLFNSRGNIQLPPGWGKTQAALRTSKSLYEMSVNEEIESNIIKSNNVMTLLYVTPNLKLVDQVFDSLDAFDTFADIPHERLIIASKSGRSKEHRTTSVDEIAAFLTSEGKSSTKNSMRFLVSTYQSYRKVAEAVKKIDSTRINFAVFDEAHVMEGNGKLFGMGLYDDNIPIDKRLFVTATPRNYAKSVKKVTVMASKLRKDGSYTLIPKRGKTSEDKNAKNREEDDGIEENKDSCRSFLDKRLFGKCIVKRTYRDSVEQNATLPLTICALDRKEIVSLVGTSGMDLANDMVSRDSLLPFAVQAAFTNLNVTHGVSFHSCNNRAREFAENAKKVLKEDISVFCVDGTMSAKERDRVLENAKKESRSIVANCRLLSTGVDETNWEMVVLADPSRGRVLTKQMIGRVTRKAPNKERGYVLVPIDSTTETDTIEEMLDSSGGYSNLLSVFNDMIELDPELRQDVLFVVGEAMKLGRDLKRWEIPKRLRETFMLPSWMSNEM